jgi:hypothetical protein
MKCKNPFLNSARERVIDSRFSYIFNAPAIENKSALFYYSIGELFLQGMLSS